jgi:DNA topoisomerase-3
MKSIVLAEKPSVGRELARVLGCTKTGHGYSEGRDYIVTWALGHLVELADPRAYDEKFATWSLEHLPMLPERMKHHVIGKTSRQFKTITKLLRRPDVDNLIIATDAGREGELVARWIMRLGGWKGSVQRLWISSQTDSAIREGFRGLRPGRSTENLFRAAECRAEADWIIGLNISRALSCKHDARLSAGRVQTPTLAMIIAREREIAAFSPQSYWTVQADFGAFVGTWRDPNGQTRLASEEQARRLADKVAAAQGKIVELTVKEKSEPPPLAYDLTALQREANSRLDWSARKTLSVLQGLYERHKIATYPRTDSRYLTRDLVPTLPDRLRALSSGRHAAAAAKLLAGKLTPGKRLINDAGVRDHHAIIPTEQPADLSRLSGDEKALWDLIVRRFLAVLSPPYRYRSITIVTEAAGERFAARGTQTIQQGWKAHESGESEEENGGELPAQSLKDHSRGEILKIRSTSVKQGFTRPPPRYTEGSLLSAMENAGRFIDDRNLRRSIAQGGLGTPATRAEIIEKLLSAYYVERRGRELAPTTRGTELLELVPEQLRSPELTARWEERLQRIASGSEKAEAFRADIRANAGELVALVKAGSARYQPRSLSSTPCPVCGRMLMPVKDKKNRKKLVCYALSCGYEQSAGEHAGLSRRPSKREKAMNRRLIDKYSDQSKETATFADLIKAAGEKKNSS